MTSAIIRQDVVLPMMNDYMQQIVQGKKNYEFRRYRITPSVVRVWFYLTAPQSHIGYICEIDNAVTRTAADEKLVEDGRIRSVYKLLEPITLATMKAKYGMKGAPRGLVYTPLQISLDAPWQDQELILRRPGVQDQIHLSDHDEDEDVKSVA
ncbi:hypothetical protein GALMADRAFT_254966 [Galerina marginata CBS 339.88]|uniref:ASCH domain-containing protein n=1 Tax=Galerina marginata (strain CBS 339.88) TaxID=685588 RepID=A0A067SGQ9_GALM3|nr:hypothetical protein GALMADRAFT_254966 [Galerina marginata CBS 339.88]